MRPQILSLVAANALVFAAAVAGQSGPAPAYTAIGRFEAAIPRDHGVAQTTTAPDVPARFVAALADAAKSDPAKINRNLIAITDDNPSLTWKGQSSDRKVLTVVYTGYTGYDPLVGQSTTLTRDVWIAIPSDLKNFCATHDVPADGLSLRLEELLGLRPNGSRTRLVEIWASPDDLFRPSPDPEITDHEAEVDFPRSGRFSSISDAHVKWINDLKAVSYLPDTGMPWTRLGYTYDWGNDDSIVGLSEFVIPAGATVEIQSTNAPKDYCKAATSSAPAFTGADVTNLASGLGGSVAPGEMVSIGGVRLGSQVYFDGRPASVTFSSPTRLSALVPEAVAGRNMTVVTVENQGAKSDPVSLPVVEGSPAIFTVDSTGQGPAVAANQDGTLNANSRPAARGSILSFWATGLGASFPAPVGSSTYAVPTHPLSVEFDGARSPAEISFAGMVYPGVAQINVWVPDDAPQNGWDDIYLSAGQSTSRTGVRVRVK